MKDPITISEVNHPRCTHRVLFPGPDGGRRARFFTTESDALAFIKKQRDELGLNGTKFGTITDPERVALSFWRSFSESRQVPDLATVLRDFARDWQARNESITLAEALTRYEAHQEAEGASKRHIKSIASRIGRLTADHGDELVATMTTNKFADWLNTLRGTRADKSGDKLGMVTRDNIRKTARAFFAFCVARGWATTNPVEIPAKKRTREHRLAKYRTPEVMLPADVERFLHKVEEVAAPILPFWLVKFFGGVRDAEAARMDWSMVDLKRNKITLPASITKTGDQRAIKIEPVLADWLAPIVEKSGPLAPGDSSRRYWYKKVLRHLRMPVTKGAKPQSFKFPSNAARHSFGTFHLFHFRDPGETAIQLGHKSNPATLWEHYANPTAEDHAAEFWTIKSNKNKVVTIAKGRRSA